MSRTQAIVRTACAALLVLAHVLAPALHAVQHRIADAVAHCHAGCGGHAAADGAPAIEAAGDVHDCGLCAAFASGRDVVPGGAAAAGQACPFEPDRAGPPPARSWRAVSVPRPPARAPPTS